MAGTELTSVEEKTLRIIVARFGEEPFSMEVLEGAAPERLTGFEAMLGVERLRERGIVVTRKKAWGERLHSLADGVFPHWQAAFFGLSLALPEHERVETVREPKRGLARLLFDLLSQISCGGGALTQKGVPHKKELSGWTAGADVTGEELEGLEIAYVHADKLPKAFAVIFDAALRLGLLQVGVGRLELVAERVRRWLKETPEERERRLQELWWDVYMPNDIWLQHAAGVLRSLRAGEWLPVPHIGERLEALEVPSASRTAEQLETAIWGYWLTPMIAFGMLERGEWKRGDGSVVACVRWKETVREGGGKWYVQPDFEVIVPPDVDFEARWHLAGLADYEGGDEVERYRLSKSSWRGALERGDEAKAGIDVLRRHAAYGVPEEVERSLQEWSDRFGSICFEDVTLLRCRDRNDAEALLASELTSPYLLSRVGDRDFIVSKLQVKALAELLERQGFSPRFTAGAADKPEPGPQRGPSSPGSASGIVYRKRASVFPVDSEPPGTEALRRRLEQVPLAWFKSLRKYHHTTMRELVETAIAVKTAVRCRRADEEWYIYPQSLQVSSNGTFQVTGYRDGKETVVASDGWEELQLYLPE